MTELLGIKLGSSLSPVSDGASDSDGSIDEGGSVDVGAGEDVGRPVPPVIDGLGVIVGAGVSPGLVGMDEGSGVTGSVGVGIAVGCSDGTSLESGPVKNIRSSELGATDGIGSSSASSSILGNG